MDLTLMLVGGGILALFMGHELFSDDDDDDGASVPDKLEIKDGVATGGNDDDVIIQESQPGTAPNFTVAYGNGGNDTIEMHTGDFVDGGKGDDVIDVSANFDGTVHGGQGDDVISAPPTGNWSEKLGIYGDSGNDTINVIEDITSFEGSPYVDGGDGDDVINVDKVLRGYRSDDLEVVTGDGADVVNINPATQYMRFEMDEMQDPWGVPLGPVRHFTAANITDFDPASDRLTIAPMEGIDDQPSIDGMPAEVTYTGYEINEENGGTKVTLTYETASATDMITAKHYVWLPGATGIPASSIEFIGV